MKKKVILLLKLGLIVLGIIVLGYFIFTFNKVSV